jgi:hypothetical protein
MKMSVTRHALKHMEDVGIQCYDLDKYVPFLKKQIIRGIIYKADDRSIQRTPLGKFATFIDHLKATTSRPSIHNNNFVSVIKNAKNRQIHIGFNTSYNDSNELSIKIFTITYNVHNLNKSLRKYSKKNFVTKNTHNKCDSYNKTKKKRTITKRSN